MNNFNKNLTLDEKSLLAQSTALVELLCALDSNQFLESDCYQKLGLSNSTNEILQSSKLGNPATLITFFYILLVMPRELLIKTQKDLDDTYKNLNIDIKSGRLCSVEVSTYPNDKITIDYLYHIRNAIAHSKATLMIEDGTTYIQFKDIHPNNDSYECTLRMTTEKAGLLLEQLLDINKEYCNNH